MQALILAGGKGMRLRPLTDDCPKGMVMLNGKPLLEHVMEQVPDAVTDFVIITGYKGEKIREYFGDSWNRHPIRYVEQKEQLGTWNAVSIAKDLIREKFIMLYGDDIGDKEAFTKAAEYDYCLLAAQVEHPERFGVVMLNADGTLNAIIEKPEHPTTNLVNSGAMILSPAVFAIKPFLHERLGEYLLTDLVSEVAKKEKFMVVNQKRWITVTYPEDVAKAEQQLHAG
jgi:NDP-sugar pyrophosphorylase family protein